MKLLLSELDNLIKLKINKDGVTHDTGNIENVLPFNSSKRTVVVRDRFEKVFGEFSRRISDVKLPDDEIDEEPELEFKGISTLTSNISKKVECDNEDIRFDLNLFLESYMFGNDNEIKSIHPYIFNYYPLSKEKQKRSEEIKVAKFMLDVLVENQSEFQNVFQNKEGENILTQLVLDNLGKLEQNKNKSKTYKPLLKVVADLFKDDFVYISKHRDYFLEYYPVLVQHYYFLYLSQLALKFNKQDNANYQLVEPLFYALDWESVNKRRSAVSLGGYKTLKEISKDLFVHIHTMSQLSHNTLNESKEFMTYCDLNEILKNEIKCEEFIQSIYEWIQIYHNKANLKQNIQNPFSISEAFKQLFDCLKEGMSTQVVNKYGESVEDAAIKKFLKLRGNYGYTLNLTQDFLLLLTAISVKDNRIPLKKLFEEFEKRGVALDRYSKKEVTELLDNLNMIEKKSDSGDAQYVKPIL
jgi:DNA phosphorothioation-dependent restriction protein DptG